MVENTVEIIDADDSECWLCRCGNYIEDGCHCTHCGEEPPWGCPCGFCQDGGEDDDCDDFIIDDISDLL